MNKRLSTTLAAAAASLLLACSATVQAAEQSLLGIRIYSTARTVLKKYGNPNYILTSGQTVATVSPSFASTGLSNGFGMNGRRGMGMGAPFGAGEGQNSSFGGGGMNPMGMAPPGSDSGGVGPLPPLNPMMGMHKGMGMGMPPEIGMRAPSAGPNPDISVQQGDTGEVTLVYERPHGVTYEFLLSPGGHVIQITALGYADTIAKTSHGVGFGATYTHVVALYGYPQDQSQTGRVTVLNYSDRSHAAFQLVDNRVVGIVVAAVD